MERELWKTLYALAREADKSSVTFLGVFTAATILGVYLWAVIWDRPVAWACQKANWPADIRPRRLPSQATMSRRLNGDDVEHLWNGLIEHFQAGIPPRLYKVIDAKPLPVGGHSKDPDADWGRGVKNFIKGYKLYAIWGAGPVPLAWEVGAARTSEQQMAEQMIPRLRPGGYLLGDKLYDINKLYDAAAAVGHQLIAQRKRPHAGLGHRCHSPSRLRCIELLKTRFGKALYRCRDRVEQDFAHLTNFGGGLAPLPNWVRRRRRVQRWVRAKLLIYAARETLLHPPATAVG